MARPISLPYRRRDAVPRPEPVSRRTIVDIFRDNTRVLADRPALRWRARDAWDVMTWADYGDVVADVGAGLVALGLEPGDRAAILSANRLEWHVADLAIMGSRAISVPVYPAAASSQVAYVLGHSGARVCVVETTEQLAKVLLRRHGLPDLERVILLETTDGLDDDFVLSFAELRRLGARRRRAEPAVFQQRAENITPEDVATIVYTSGTTGPPKGAVITHANVMATMRSLFPLVQLTPEDRFLSFLPLSHITERSVSHFGHILAGGETWFARSFATVAEDLRACRPTIFFAVPRVWEKFRDAIVEALGRERGLSRRAAESFLALGEIKVAHEQFGTPMHVTEHMRHGVLDRLVGAAIRRRAGLDQARILASGAAPIHPELLRWFHAIGLHVAEGYGQTEVSLCTTLNPLRRIRLGTVGVPIPGVEVRIAADGEILVRGGNVCAGYWRNDAATAELIDADGWLHSGDLGTLDDKGYLRITGRKKDLIITTSGKNVAPQEIETRLRYEPIISQAVVIGDARPYLTALLTLDADGVASWARDHGKALDIEALTHDPDLGEAVADAVHDVNEEHARVEQIKKWRILDHDFTVTGGELTPTLKVRRDVVELRYHDLIDEMYAA